MKGSIGKKLEQMTKSRKIAFLPTRKMRGCKNSKDSTLLFLVRPQSRDYLLLVLIFCDRKVFTEIARVFPAEIGNPSNFSGQKQVFLKKKKVFIPKTSQNLVSVHKKH